MKINSLKTRVLVWFGSIVAIILILFSFSFRYFLNQSINTNIETKLSHHATDILTNFRKNTNTLKSFESKNLYITIVQNQKSLFKSKKFPLIHLNKYLKNKKTFYTFEDNEDDETIDALYLLKDKNYTILLYKKNIDNKIENFEDTLLVLDSLLLILLILVASKLIDKILFPIQKITQAAQNISINSFSKTIELPKDDDELRALVLSFNHMIKRLKSGVDNLDRFNTNVSHELKTPLTVIKGEIEITLRKTREIQEYIKSLKTINYEASQIEHIVENLLLLTKYSKENIKETFEVCYLDTIILNAIEKYDTKIQKKQLKLHIQKIEPIVLNSNHLLLYTIFSNLIDNAVKYTQKDKRITISLYKDANNVHLIVDDEGVGISKEDLSKITERFYRVDSSRNKTIQGFGLGLALVQNSIKLLDGEMKITSILNKGTIVNLAFRMTNC